MTNLKGTLTEQNLKKAMQGEALAYTKYQIYASLIGKESKNIENKINHIAHNEKEHFKIWAKLLLEDQYYKNEMNLLDAIIGETHECKDMYPEFAKVAREEGFEDIAKKFDQISLIECNHSLKFEEFLDLVENEKSIERKNKFICLNCGYIHNGEDVPKECPVCYHPKEYFTSVD